MIDTKAFGDYYTAGKMTEMMSEARAILAQLGQTEPPRLPFNINSPEDEPYKRQRERALGNIRSAANAFIGSVGAASSSTGAARDTAVAQAVKDYQALQLHTSVLAEIDRSEKGDKVGTGGGLPEVGEPPWVARLEKKIDKLLAR